MKWLWIVASLLFLTLPVMAGDPPKPEAEGAVNAAGPGIGAGLLGIGAALAVGLGGLATGIAQSRIGAAGAGVVAENQKLSGFIFLLIALPETLVLFGFVISFLLLSKIP